MARMLFGYCFTLLFLPQVLALTCPPGWVGGANRCYYFSKEAKKGWYPGNEECKKKEESATLLKIESVSENDFIKSEVQKRPETSYWLTGLHHHREIRCPTNWRWEDDANADLSFVNWAKEPTDWRGGEHCGELEKDGVYNDARCTAKMGYICKYIKRQPGEQCPPNWIQNSQDTTTCYFVSTRAQVDQMTWQDARLACQTKQPDSDLLTVETQTEWDFIKQRVMHFWKIRMLSDGWWTGLNRPDVRAPWVWNDGTQVKTGYIEWNQEPNPYGSKHFCARFYSEGQYEDEDCDAQQQFICQVMSRAGICPSPDWMVAGGMCHLAVLQKVNWYYAQQYCPAIAPGATLAKITSQAILSELSLQLSTSYPKTAFWTALNDRDQGDRCYLWYWAKDEEVDKNLITWTKEPQNLSGNQHCARIGLNGVYMDYDCYKSSGFICKVEGSCPLPVSPGWDAWMGNCYFFSDQERDTRCDIETARSRCRILNPQAKLLWVDSDEERNWIRDKVGMLIVNTPNVQRGSAWYWTDLNDNLGGVWSWNNQPADPNLLDWNQEPNDFGIKIRGRDCASMHMVGTFHEKSCFVSTQFICSMHTKPQAGAITAIAIVTFAVVIAVSIGLYCGIKKYYDRKFDADKGSNIPYTKEEDKQGVINQDFSSA